MTIKIYKHTQVVKESSLKTKKKYSKKENNNYLIHSTHTSLFFSTYETYIL